MNSELTFAKEGESKLSILHFKAFKLKVTYMLPLSIPFEQLN